MIILIPKKKPPSRQLQSREETPKDGHCSDKSPLIDIYVMFETNIRRSSRFKCIVSKLGKHNRFVECGDQKQDIAALRNDIRAIVQNMKHSASGAAEKLKY